MSSANEEMHPPPHQQRQKARVSPLEFRNTDLVSRLLAATPPYLYNMPLVPHSYFFSEMLRSFVQAKTDATNRNNQTLMPPQQRRARKRSWTHVNYQKHEQPSQKHHETTKEMPPPPSTNWPPKMSLDKQSIFDKPLELTMKHSTHNNNNNGATKICEAEKKPSETQSVNDHQHQQQQHHLVVDNGGGPSPPGGALFPSAEAAGQQQDIVLPPPPPLWYPPIYPGPPYPGFDPLHFFIDLRVSGHIYDRKGGTQQKDAATGSVHQQQHHHHHHHHQTDDVLHGLQGPSYFKQPRLSSAFSVPSSNPMNLTNGGGGGDVKVKFDVKSMGFEKTDNKTSTNYIMQNIDGIYKRIGTEPPPPPPPTPTPKELTAAAVDDDDDENVVAAEETEEEKQKRVKDLRALIGLELVVDYMNHHQKPQGPCPPKSSSEEESATDLDQESRCSSSPAVEVVSITDNDNFVYN